MKAAHLHLNATFTKTKSGVDNSSGSITPRTTTKKAILGLDQVSINYEATRESYQKQKDIKFSEALKKLEQDLQLKYKELEHLEILLKKIASKHVTSNMLDEVSKDIDMLKIRQKLMDESVSDNYDIKNFGFETIYQEDIRENDGNEVSEDTQFYVMG